MSFSYWPHERDKHNVKKVSGMRVASDDKLPDIMSSRLWSAVVWEPAYRARVNFKYADWVALDFDEGPSLEDIKRRFCDCRCIIGTTRNHQKEKITQSGFKPACDRFRMAIQLEKRCECLEDFEFTLKTLQRNLDADPAATDGARLLFPCTDIVFQNLDQYAERQEILEAPPVDLRKFQFEEIQLAIPGMAQLLAHNIMSNIKKYKGRNHAAFIATTKLKLGGFNEQSAFCFLRQLTDLEEDELLRTVAQGFKHCRS